MLIYVNGRFLSQPITGVQRFAFELCKRLIEVVPEVKIVVPAKCIVPDVFQDHAISEGGMSGTLWEQVELSQFMKRNGDVLLNLCNTAPMGYHNNVVAIHDLGVYENPEWYDWKFSTWYRFLTPRIVNRARAILTVSVFSKQDLVTRFKLNEGFVHVVHNGLPSTFQPPAVQSKEKIILHVGTFSKRKNVKFLVDAFLKASNRGFKLVLCGSMDSNLNTQEITSSSDRVEVVENPTDKKLSELYGAASYVISASHNEGFGIPILEGIAHAARPLISNIAVHKELYSDVAQFFSLSNSDELVTLLSELPEEVEPLDPTIIKTYLERYDFNRSATKIAEILKGL